MISSGIDLSTYGYLLVALSHTALAVDLAFRRRSAQPRGVASILFGGAIVATACWGWLGAAGPFIDKLSASAAPICDLLRYALWFALLLVLLRAGVGPTGKLSRHALSLAACLLIAAGLATIDPSMAAGTDAQLSARWELFTSLARAVFGLMLVEQFFRNAAEESRWHAKPLCLALGVVFIFDLFLYSQALLFGRVDADAASIRGFIHALSAPLMLVAVSRHKDWMSKLHVSRTVAFHSASMLLAGTYLLFIAAVGYYVRYFGGEWGSALQLATLFAALTFFAVLAVSGSVRSKLRVLVGKHFFRYRYDYREEWLRFTSRLSAKNSPNELGGSIIRGLADMVESPGGCLWTRIPGTAQFSQTSRWNMPETPGQTTETDSVLSTFMVRTGWIIDLDEYRATPQRYEGLQMPPWVLASLQFWLVVPLIFAGELIGFAILQRPRATVDVNWEVIDLLKTASRQAAGFLAQMHATEALLEARKFDAFNRMSAFVVHDLKNIVTQLSLMMKNAQRLRDNPEFQEDMLATVESSLEKMRQLMLQLREGKAPPGGVSGVDLVPIVRRIEAAAARRGRAVEMQVVEPVTARGHEERIERVLGHVVQNALDATAASGRVWLKLERASGQAKVEIGDTGEGMSPEYIHTRLFKPFQTTKTTGMGIGTFESLQYVRELGGNISVSSELNSGTVMTILMPLFEGRHAADRQLLSAK